MNYRFKNSSIVSINFGTIVLNVSGKTRTFMDAKLVSAVNGDIVLDLPSFKLTKGAYVTIHLDHDSRIQRTFISNTDNEYLITYHVTQYSGGIKFNGDWDTKSLCRNATLEEIEELNDQLAAEGKRWNPDTMQIEKLRWKPKFRETYYAIVINVSGMYISDYLYNGDPFDEQNCKLGNCFQTRKEAEIKLTQIQKLLLEV